VKRKMGNWEARTARAERLAAVRWQEKRKQERLERQAESMARERRAREEPWTPPVAVWWYECGRCGLKLKFPGGAEEEAARQQCLRECGAAILAEIAEVGREEWRRQGLLRWRADFVPLRLSPEGKGIGPP
jgi:hypothetical protein